MNLAPLVAPHRKVGRISIRVERLPQQARFSRGNRNSNGTWSLASDELDDLFYHVPEGTGEHTLAVRVINLAGGNTLAVVDFPVTPVTEVQQEDQSDDTPDEDTDELVQRLRRQLAQMKAALTDRESELAEVRKAAHAAAASKDTDAELDAVRAELQAEFDERLAAVGAQSAADLKKQRESWASDMNTRLAALSAKAQQQLNEAGEIAEREKQQALDEAKAAWQREEAERLAKAKTAWRAEADKAAADAADALDKKREADLESLRSQLQRQAQDALRTAEQGWNAAEAARIASAESEWHAKAQKQLDELRMQFASVQGEDAERALNTLRIQLEDEAKEALFKAEQQWKFDEATRLAAAKAEWQAALETALKEERAASATGEKNSDTALKDLRDELRAMRISLAERDAALAEARNVGERAAREAQENLAAAETRWKKDEATRLEAERAKWRAESEHTVAKARADIAAQTQGGGAVQEELRQQLAALSTKLAEKDTALAGARAKIEELRNEKEAAVKAKPAAASSEGGTVQALQDSIETLEQRLAESEAALNEARDIIEQQRRAAKAKPQRTRKSEEAGEDQRWQAITNELAEARSRYEAAELALAQVRMRAKDDGRIQQELTSTRAALAAREKELSDLRAKFAPLDGQEIEGAAQASSLPTSEPAVKAQFSMTFIGGVIAAACLFAIAIVFYPTIQATLFPPPPPKPVPELKETARLEPVIVETKALMVRDAKLRADPSSSAKPVATVTKGFEVIIVESKGKWTLVRMGSDAKAQQGWVLQSSLDEITSPRETSGKQQ